MGNMIRSEATSEKQKTPEPFEEIDNNYNFPKVNFPLLSCVVWRCDSRNVWLSFGSWPLSPFELDATPDDSKIETITCKKVEMTKSASQLWEWAEPQCII